MSIDAPAITGLMEYAALVMVVVRDEDAVLRPSK